MSGAPRGESDVELSGTAGRTGGSELIEPAAGESAVEMPSSASSEPAAAACRNGALEGAAVAAERADSAGKFDGVPVVGPDEGAAGSD